MSPFPMAMEQDWHANPASVPAAASRRVASSALLAEVRDGLFRPVRELPARFLGEADVTPLRRQLQRLADQTHGPVEAPMVRDALAALLDTWAPRALVHFTPADSRGAATAIDAAVRAGSLEAYVAADVAAAPADEAVERVRAAHPGLDATRIVTDPTTSLPLPRGLARPRLLLALGNALGTFGTIHAIRFLRLVQASMHGGDRLLLGLDLRRDAEALEAEHERDAGLRASYHRHALRVLERDLGAEVDATRFAYRASFLAEKRRVEHRLVATSETRIVVPGLAPVVLAPGEGVLTAVSCTFERASLFSMLAGVGLSLDSWTTNVRGDYAVATASPVR